MSLYNLINGMNADLAVLISVIIGENIQDKFPRFRDVFLEVEESRYKADYYVYTRMGGGNRECWEDNKPDCKCPACVAAKIEQSPECVGRYDDNFDCTYSNFCMNFTDAQKKEWESFKKGQALENFKERILKIFPNIKQQVNK